MSPGQQRHGLRLVTELSLAPAFALFAVLLVVLLLVLPASRESTVPKNPSHILNLAIDKAGAMTLEDRKIAGTDLESELATLLKDHPGAGVRVRADRDLSAQQLVDLMAKLRHAGVQKTAVTTAEK